MPRSAIVSVLLALMASLTCAPSRAMDVKIVYSPFLDGVCSVLKGYEIKDVWKAELSDKQAQLQSAWETYGGKLLSATESTVGKPFQRASVTVHLTLCNTRSRAFPVIVNMRYALSGFTAAPVPVSVKAGTLFHELLHPYVRRNRPEKSELLERYPEEPSEVKAHLHLLALVKAVYLKLAMREKLAALIQADDRLPGGHYKRAWEIVNATPGYYLAFVDELKRS